MIGLYIKPTDERLLFPPCSPGPSNLTLDGQMSLESVVGFSVVEDLLERRILERSTVNITGDPVIVEYRSTLVI